MDAWVVVSLSAYVLEHFVTMINWYSSKVMGNEQNQAYLVQPFHGML